MQIVPGTATRDDVSALRDVLEVARYPGTAPPLAAATFVLFGNIIADVERSIRRDVLVRHMEPAERAAQFVPGELDPEDGA